MLEYRADFLFWGFVSVMWTAFNFFFTGIIVGSSGFLAGWNTDEVFVLLSIFTIYDAFTWSFFYFNMQRYMNKVFTGELDMFLVKPVDPQFMLSVEHNSYNNLFRLFIGIGMLIISLIHLNKPITLFSFLIFVIMFVLGFILTYSVWFMFATISFWVDRLDNLNDVMPSLRRLSQLPRSVYSGVSSFLFCMVLPVVLVTSIPAEALVHKISPLWNLYYTVFTLVIFWVSRRFFYYSIKKYSSAGS
ncbi:MAG: ABC-2 family transporter protein [Patescibacteria group bacterium]